VFSRYLILFFIGTSALTSLAQDTQRKGPRIGSSIIDDSTKAVYGPKTSRWTTHEDIFYNRNNYLPIDTSITNYHRWTYVSKLNNFYKDLGNNGTALVPIFPTMPSTIGVNSGYTSYEQYFLANEVKYYDTKSPYTRIYIVWGGYGRATTAAEFSRNINPRWNFGFNYRPILIDKQIQRTRKGDRHVISQYYDAYTAYRSKDEKYSVLVNFQRMKHRVKDNGGISEEASLLLANGIFDANARPLLTSAETMELRTNVHGFQQYKVGKALQLYHMVDRTKQRNGFFDLPVDSSNFDYQEYYLDSVFDRTQIKTFQNEVGVKGNLSKLFYNFYYKIRKYDLQNNRLQNIYPGDVGVYDDGVVYNGYENYLGGRVSLELDSITKLSGWAEYLTDGNYRIEGNLNTPWLDASLKNMRYKPGFMQNFYRGSHDYWKNFYTNSNSLQATGFLKGKLGSSFFVSPGFTYTLLSNYVFMKEDVSVSHQQVKPIQSSGLQQVVSPELRLNLVLWKKFYFRPNIIYTRLLQNADGALSIPELFVNTQLAFEGFLFKKNLFAHAGIDFHWQSDYYALGYDTPTQQFFVQNSVMTKAYPLVDVFFNGRIKRGKFFVRYHNLMQLFTGKGYVLTPAPYHQATLYPGQRNILDFGFELLLFD
jgi:Putative porin